MRSLPGWDISGRMSPLGRYVLETLVTLVAVVALAAFVLVTARRVGIGRPAGPLELVGRLPLDGRRTVYLVRVAESVLVLGASEAGLSKLAELPVRVLGDTALQPPRSAFAAALGRALGSKPTPGVEPGSSGSEGEPSAG